MSLVKPILLCQAESRLCWHFSGVLQILSIILQMAYWLEISTWDRRTYNKKTKTISHRFKMQKKTLFQGLHDYDPECSALSFYFIS